MARYITRTDAYVAASYARKKVEILFAHLKRIIGLDRQINSIWNYGANGKRLIDRIEYPCSFSILNFLYKVEEHFVMPYPRFLRRLIKDMNA